MDLKGLGYIISIISVVLLGAVAWPKPADPDWMGFALIAGMATAIVGMLLRYIAHRKERRELEQAKRASETRPRC